MFDFVSTPKYCVNLARRTDRRALMESEFKRHGLVVEFVTAVDGRALVMPELSRKREPYAAANWACLLSHRGIIERATTEYICVFEDDITLCADFTRRAAAIDCDFDIFYLGGGTQESDSLEPIAGGYYRVRAMAGTWAYIMRNTVFQYALRNITYDWGPDEFFSEVLLKRCVGMAQLPMMVTSSAFDSDIGGPTPARWGA